MTERNITLINKAASMSKELEDLARHELGETPEMKQQALKELRELISGEPLLDCPTDEAFLVKFLRARKYNLEKTFDLVKNYFKFRRDMPEIFGGLTPDSIPFDTVCGKHWVFTASRKKDPQGRIAIMLSCDIYWLPWLKCNTRSCHWYIHEIIPKRQEIGASRSPRPYFLDITTVQRELK